jgi:predicted helicase
VSIQRILEELRINSTSEKDKGDKFEKLMLAFFQSEPTYTSQFKNVWLWKDWKGNQGRPDTGIDLVAENVHGSGFTAIQCKFYAPNVTLEKKDIDSFFTESGKAPFTHRIIVSTTNNWSIHALNSLVNQDKPTSRIGIPVLENSAIDWNSIVESKTSKLRLKDKKIRKPHQEKAIASVLEGFKQHDRGKLIMACGTGKTFTAQCITEDLVNLGGTVLVLVPSISLLSQTVKEWTADSAKKINVFAVCSDSKAGRRKQDEDLSIYDLVIPATTDTKLLVDQFKNFKSKDSTNIIFSTYQSLPIVQQAQTLGIPEFDLIICDEAHRTVGVTLQGQEDSNFTKIHNNDYIKGKKRLYMTATPRVYSPSAKAKAEEADATYASMDDYETYGEEFYRLRFYEAVNMGELTDYKVLVLTVNEEAVASAFQQQLSDSNSEIKLDEATKIVGCLNAFAKHDPENKYFVNDKIPMKRVVAFSNTIANSEKFKRIFNDVSQRFHNLNDTKVKIEVEVKHIDGTFNSFDRDDLLGWLKQDPSENNCSVLTNARCLTEGVDVPSLDAIVFLEPRNSMVDVIQAVGRVMRKSPNKQYGYVIIPIGIPANMSPEEALDNNERFQAVWTVLNALRSHDERLDAEINKLDLSGKKPENIEIIPVSEVTLKTGDEIKEEIADDAKQLEISFPAEEIQKAIYAKLVEKVGTRIYLEKWATDVAVIVAKQETRINALLKDKKLGISKQFDQFLAGLKANINESVTREEAISMLSQHLITKPIFDALFSNFKFADNNPVSKVMDKMIDILEFHSLDQERESLNKFYSAIKLRVEGIDSTQGRQKIMTELYERFFKIAFPKLSDQLGIVYTPVEIVDFILNSVQELLLSEFNTKLSNKDVHLFDPFTGTGTFIARLISENYIELKDLTRKFENEIHANEIVLLAYYIAAINVESVFYEKTNNKIYKTFEGIVLTDTFQMYEDGDLLDEVMFKTNNERVVKQKKSPINVIIGNPPYSAGQRTQNDNAQNLKYLTLDQSIESTYAKNSEAGLKRFLYDSYIRAFRLASNRIGKKGIIAFVTNGMWIDSSSSDGLRKTFQNEFTSIYVFNLRGNQRTSGEQSRKEGGKIFGSGSRTPVAITLLVKNPNKSEKNIFYYDIGDSLSREEKLKIIKDFGSVKSINWESIIPNSNSDWINQRNEEFKNYYALGEKNNSTEMQIFSEYSLGLLTNRDAWVYNSSQANLTKNVNSLINYFEECRKELNDKKNKLNFDKFIEKHSDSSKISWSAGLKNKLESNKKIVYVKDSIRTAMYRPFFKQKVYFNSDLNERPSIMPKIFPDGESENLIIGISGAGSVKDFSVLMTNVVSDLNMLTATKYFPLYIYSNIENSNDQLNFESSDTNKIFNISNKFHELIMNKIDKKITKEDIFFYVYGIFHSKEYLNRFQSDLRKEMPRIPLSSNFKEISRLGFELSQLHINYEKVDLFDNLDVNYGQFNNENIKIQSLKLDKKLNSLYINNTIKINQIPQEVFEYKVNGLSPLEWIVDRYNLVVNKDSQIINDPNEFSNEKNYVLKLIYRSMTVGIKSQELINKIPKLDII